MKKTSLVIIFAVLSTLFITTESANALVPTISSYTYPNVGLKTASSNPISGWTTIGELSGVDDVVSPAISIGFNISYNGVTYSSLKVTSNSVICFGSCSNSWSGFTSLNPPGASIQFCARDYDSLYVAYKSDINAGTFQLRYEGKQHGVAGDAVAFWEATFYKDSNTFDMGMFSNSLCTSSGASSGFTDGSSATYLKHFIATQTDALANTGYRVSFGADTTAPTVSSLNFSANAGADNTFISGDVITATVNWSEAVTITGSPRIPILGLTSKYLTFSGGSGTTATTFTYTVASGDTDVDGIAISVNTLELNSGTIKDAAGNNATLTHSAVAASTSLKVDTTIPVHSSSTVNETGTQLTMTYGEALSSTTAATSAFAVVAAGSSVSVSSATVSGSTVVLALASTVRIGQVVTVAYTDPTAGNDASAVQDVGGNDASSLSATSVTNNSTVKQSQATFTFAGGTTTYGTNLRLLSSGGSGTGAISYSVSSGNCAVATTDSLTASSAGSCVVVARKATDSTYLDAYDTKTVTVNKASQAKLTIGQYTAFVGISTYPINVYGGSGTGAISRTLAAPGSANCTLQSGLFVQAASVGSCTITAVKAADTNYLAETTTAAIYWVTWSDAYATRVPSAPTEIILQHKTQITKYNYETLTVTSYKDGFGNPVTSITPNSQLRIIGDGFNSADTTTEVVFGNAEIVDMNYSSPALQVVSDGSGGYYLLVTVPSGATTDNVLVNSAKGTARGPVLTIL